MEAAGPRTVQILKAKRVLVEVPLILSHKKQTQGSKAYNLG